MMITTKRLAVSVAALFLAQGALACDYPEAVKDFPDGNNATQEEMLAAQKKIKTYVMSMEAYLDCIKSEEAQAVIAMGDVDEDTREQRDKMFNKKHDAAVEEMNTVAEKFNVQVRAFKARSN